MIREQIRVHSAYAFVDSDGVCRMRAFVRCAQRFRRSQKHRGIREQKYIRAVVWGQIHGWFVQKSRCLSDNWERMCICGRLIVKVDRFSRFVRRRFNNFFFFLVCTRAHHYVAHIASKLWLLLLLLFFIWRYELVISLQKENYNFEYIICQHN